MFFGASTFSQVPFSDAGVIGNSTVVTPSGSRFNISIGNITTIPDQKIGVTGNRFNLATNPVSVIVWNGIVPGVSQIWIPIDPEE